MASKEPLIIKDKNEMREWSRSMRSQGKSISLVPTMGYLHKGHISLIEQAHRLTNLVVVSIYINPTQFAPSEDLSTYPSDFPADFQKLCALGIDAVFNPYNLYESDHETWVRVQNLEEGMCGKSRPLFFRGVATVVAKLFNIVEPDVAVFGKKDYQQWRVILRMVRDLDFSINVVGSEIVRDVDGLALSSRNVHLSPEDREKALSINRSLSKAKFAAESGELNCKLLKDLVIHEILGAGGKLDYAEIVEQESLQAVEEIKSPVVFLVAAWFGKVRLIDNMEINI